MKKILLVLSIVSLLYSCSGGNKQTSSDNDTTVTPKLEKLQNTSDSTATKAEDINKKADSLLKNI